MKTKKDLLKNLKAVSATNTFERALLTRFDTLIEVLADIRTVLNNGKDE